MTYEDLVSGKVKLVFGDPEQLKAIKDYVKKQDKLEKQCKSCDGSGEVECSYCDGNGEMECEDCGGSGEK